MREIKFRGKSTHTNEWVYGNYVGNCDEPTICGFDIYRKGSSEWWQEEKVEEFSVGQYTGLKDRNGKEIYEGDIVLWERKKVHIEGCPLQDFSDVCKIYYDDQLHAFCRWYKLTCGSVSGLLNFNDDRAEASYFEVIGNIHDNPELLEGGQQ